MPGGTEAVTLILLTQKYAKLSAKFPRAMVASRFCMVAAEHPQGVAIYFI